MSDFSTAISQFVTAIIRQRDARLDAATSLEGNPADSDALQAWNECTRLSDAVEEAYRNAITPAREAGVLSKLSDAMDAHITFMGADSDEVDDVAMGLHAAAISKLIPFRQAAEVKKPSKTSADAENISAIAEGMDSAIGKKLFRHQMKGRQDQKSIKLATDEFFRKHKWRNGIRSSEKESEMENAKRAARRAREKLKGE